jgi:hypothetical protein
VLPVTSAIAILSEAMRIGEFQGMEQLAALSRSELPPGPEGRLGGADRPVDILGAAAWDQADLGVVGGILDRDGSPLGGVQPLTADEHLAGCLFGLDQRAASFSGTNEVCARCSK